MYLAQHFCHFFIFKSLCQLSYFFEMLIEIPCDSMKNEYKRYSNICWKITGTRFFLVNYGNEVNSWWERELAKEKFTVSNVDMSISVQMYMVFASFYRTLILTPSHLPYGIQAQNRPLVYVANCVLEVRNYVSRRSHNIVMLILKT